MLLLFKFYLLTLNISFYKYYLLLIYLFVQVYIIFSKINLSSKIDYYLSSKLK